MFFVTSTYADSRRPVRIRITLITTKPSLKYFHSFVKFLVVRRVSNFYGRAQFWNPKLSIASMS